MKYAVAILLMAVTLPAIAQTRYNVSLLDSLAYIANTNTTAKHFAGLYYRAVEITNKYADKQPNSVKNFVFGFESLFGPAFTDTYQNAINNSPQTFFWQQYYQDTTLNDLQYKFIGMAAHINGDMWIALKDKYGYDTLKKYRKPLLKFQKILNTFFDSIYTAPNDYKKLGRLRILTLGMDKYIGRTMVLHWRKKQVRMAMLYYTNPQKCMRKAKHLEKIMLRYKRFAVKWIK